MPRPHTRPAKDGELGGDNGWHREAPYTYYLGTQRDSLCYTISIISALPPLHFYYCVQVMMKVALPVFIGCGLGGRVGSSFIFSTH